MIITVSRGESIQQAVIRAAPGDTILVRRGTFNENVSIGLDRDRIRIIGAGPGETILNGTGLGGSGYNLWL